MADSELKTQEAIELGTLQLDEVLGDVLDDMGGDGGMDDVLGTLDDDHGSDDDDDSQHSGTQGTRSEGNGKNNNNLDTGLQASARSSARGEDGENGSQGGGGFDDDGSDDEKVKSPGDLDQIVEDLDIEEVDNFDDDEDEDDFLKQYKLVKEKILTLEEQHEKQNIMDDACMILLKPDYFKVTNRIERREMLRNNNPSVKTWPAQELDDTIVVVAESMCVGNTVDMYDSRMMNTREARKREQYMLREVDLSQVKGIPQKYFRGRGGDASDNNGLEITDDETSENEADEFDTVDLDDVMVQQKSLSIGGVSSGVANTLKKFGKVAQKEHGHKIVCAGCGLKMKFKSKHREKDNFVAFHCEKTNKFYVFHDHVCVHLRKLKEAIRMYVFTKERELNPDDPDPEASFISIDVDSQTKPDRKARPRHFTTPKQGDFNYDQDYDEEPSESSNNAGQAIFGAVQNTIAITKNLNVFTQESEEKEENPIKHPNFRRYRMQVESIMTRLNMRGRDATYKERFGELPKLLLFCDLSEFGVALWEFVSDALKSKMRASLWTVLRFLALEMPTNEVLELLKNHTYLLTKHMLMEYDDLCKATMEGAKHPIATALRLSAFMFERAKIDLSNGADYKEKGEEYAKISRKLLKEIESDHLFAMLLQMPTDLGGLSIVEIALKYELTYFLEEPRIVRVFNVLWFGGFDFLDPGSNFQDSELSFADVYLRLVREPGRFYFSPVGKFYSSSVLYIFFLCLFSYITLIQRYNYDDDPDWIEWVFWAFTLGFVMHEVVEFIDAPGEYLTSVSNFFDIFISCNWLTLAYLRILDDKDAYRQFDETGQLADELTRNELRVEIYMFLWAIQSVLLWTRVATVFQTSRSVGPLIRMILNMLSDIANWGIITSMFFIGTGLAVYYIIGKDLVASRGVGGIANVYLYIFQTLIGQQDWDQLSSETVDGVEVFDNIRSNMCIFFILIFSVFGAILLLNLLIAMMASSYESVKDRSNMELNKQRIDKTYELDRSRAIIAPPMNLIAYIFYLYWWAFETIAWVLTFGHRQFNEEYFSPLNRGAHQYRPGDRIKFEKGGKKITALVKKRTSIKARLAGNTQGMDRRRTTIDGKGSADENSNTVWDLEVSHARKKYELRDSDVLKVKKPFFKRRTRRIPTVDIENVFCRFCRYNISDDSMDIQYYLNIFEQKGQHIDPEDKLFMKSLLSPSDSKYLIPNPKACDLCPNCFRPFKVSRDGSKDTLIRRVYILELVSYFAYRISVWPLLILMMAIPANIARIIRFVKKTILFAAGDEEDEDEDIMAKSREVMNRSEQNDDYRSTVRRVSKQEEDLNQMVKRIDLNVVRLEKEILGRVEAEYEPADEEIDEIESFRNDSFNKRVDSMRKEMHDRFDEMRRLLEESGIAKDDHDDHDDEH